MKPVGALRPFFIAVGALSLAAAAYQGQQQPSGIVSLIKCFRTDLSDVRVILLDTSDLDPVLRCAAPRG